MGGGVIWRRNEMAASCEEEMRVRKMTNGGSNEA